MQQYPDSVADPLELTQGWGSSLAKIPSALWGALKDRYQYVQDSNKQGYYKDNLADAQNPDGAIMARLGNQVAQQGANPNRLADASTFGTPDFVAKPNEIPLQQPPKSQVTAPPMNDKTKEVFNKGLQNNSKEQNSQQMDMRKRMEDYMRKREELAIDSQARLGKLDAAYNNQGTNFGAMAGFADALSGGQTNYSQLAKSADADRMSPQKYALLRDRLQNNQVNNYGALTKDAMNSLRQDALTNQWAKNAALKEKLAGMKSAAKPLPAEVAKRLDYIKGMKGDLKGIEKLLLNSDTSMLQTTAALKTGFLPDTELARLLRNAAENYGRMQSGGAISTPEEKRFLASLFKVGDSKEMLLKKSRAFQKLMDQREQTLMTGRGYTPVSLGNLNAVSGNSFKKEDFGGRDWSSHSTEDIAKAYYAAGGK